MHDAEPVRGGQRVRDLRAHLDRLGPRQGALGESQLQLLTAEQLHHHERGDRTVRVHRLAVVVHRGHVRVHQLGGGAGLLAHHVPEPGVGGQRRGEHLERDDPVQHLVTGTPDDRHAAGADLVDEPVSAGQQPARMQRCLHGSHLPWGWERYQVA
ncbi:hypothetical protein GCM10027614_61660 [Micromonospora vulcania]